MHALYSFDTELPCSPRPRICGSYPVISPAPSHRAVTHLVTVSCQALNERPLPGFVSTSHSSMRSGGLLRLPQVAFPYPRTAGSATGWTATSSSTHTSSLGLWTLPAACSFISVFLSRWLFGPRRQRQSHDRRPVQDCPLRFFWQTRLAVSIHSQYLRINRGKSDRPSGAGILRRYS